MEPTPVRTTPRRRPQRVIDVTDAATSGAPPPAASGDDRCDVAWSVAALSAVAEQLERIAARNAGDPEIAGRVSRLADHTRHAVRHLLVSSSERTRTGLAARATSANGATLASAEDAFVAWVRSVDQPDHAERAVVEGGPRTVRELLAEVLASRRPLPADVARSLGVPQGTTTGGAAAWLLGAVEDPAGPQCRSYRAAVYYLRDLADPAALVR